MYLPRLDADDYGNERLQALVRRVHPDDVPSFVEKLKQQPLGARFHTYRELLVGVHLRDRGFDVRYERKIGEKTPDWCLANEDNSPLEIVDVLTLHQRHDKDVEIRSAIMESGQWAGWITVPPDHVYRKLSDKAGQYSALARELDIPYVLAVYGEFTASIAPEEMAHVLLAAHGGWFKGTPEVSGIIYFRERSLELEYTYYLNDHAERRSMMALVESTSREA